MRDTTRDTILFWVLYGFNVRAVLIRTGFWPAATYSPNKEPTGDIQPGSMKEPYQGP